MNPTSLNSSTGAYSYIPKANVIGVDTFNFKANNGTLESKVATVMITIHSMVDVMSISAGNASSGSDTHSFFPPRLFDFNQSKFTMLGQQS